MRWRLYWFVLRRRGLVRRALIGVAAAALLGLVAPRIAARQEFTLSVRLSEPEFASAILVQTSDGAAVGQLPNRAGEAVRFTLKRGDYLVTALPTSTALQQHWAFAVVPVHLDRDQGLSLRGAYGLP